MKGLPRAALGGLLLIVLMGVGAEAGAPSTGIPKSGEGTATGEISVIVKLSDEIDPARFEAMPKAERRRAVIRSLREKAEASQGPLKGFLKSRGARRVVPLWLINGLAVTAEADVIGEVRRFPGVEEVVEDDVITLSPVTLDAETTAEWNIDAIGARDLWALGYKGQGVVVANMDTGVDLNHPDLKKRWRGGNNSWFDPYRQSSRPYDILSAGSGIGHGTLTMGIMVGGNAGGTGIGAAPRAKWIAVKIFNDLGQTTLSVIHQGFQWLLDPDGNPDTDDAPDIVNNSWALGSPGDCITEFRRDIANLRAAGIAVVFAAGNSGPDAGTSLSPANHRGAFSVGAVNPPLKIARFSSRGPSACDGTVFPDVVAPGVSIRSSDRTSIDPDPYATVSGTSFAVPHAAGAMALLLSAFPGLTVRQLEEALISTAMDLGDPGPDNAYGNGMIHVKRAYDRLKSKSVTVTFSSQTDLDGRVRESAAGSGRGGFNNSVGDLVVGDDARNRQLKSILSFGTAKIPDNAAILSARLLLRRKNVFGTNPFHTHGQCYIDINRGTLNERTLENKDFQTATTAKRVAVMSAPVQNGKVSRGVVDATGLKAINKRGVTQMRIYFSRPTDGNSVRDVIVFWGDNGLPSQRPRLEVTYMPP